MDLPALLTASDVADFPGAPYPDGVLVAVGGLIRSQAGWHIAPEVTETVVVESEGGVHMLLPTMDLSSVTAVRSLADDGTTTVISGYRTAPTVRFRAGILTRSAGWPCGAYEVDIVHGYEACPADLAEAAASLCQLARLDGSIGSVRLGSLSIAPTGVPSSSAAQQAQPDAVISRYTLPGRP